MLLAEVSPPADWLDRRGTKFYCRSGELSVVLSTEAGPIHAAYLFGVHAINRNRLHRLGDCIEVSESDSFGGGDVLVRRETGKFLRNKFGIGEPLLTALIAKELSPED